MRIWRLHGIRSIVAFSVIFLFFATFPRISFAIVVLPIIAVGLLQLVVQLLSVISIPIVVIVKILSRWRLLKSILVSLAVLLLISGLVVGIMTLLKLSSGTGYSSTSSTDSAVQELSRFGPENSYESRNAQRKREMPTPLNAPTKEEADLRKNGLVAPNPVLSVYPLTIIFSGLAFLPALFTILAIDHKRNSLSVVKKIILAGAFSATLGCLASILLLGITFL